MPTPAASHRDEHLSDESAEAVECEMVVLTARDWEAFLAEWDNADRPRPRLEEAARRYQSRRQRDAG